MKVKSEKGITGMDMAGGLVIFTMAAASILTIYYNIYINAISIKIHQTAVGYIAELFERVDLENYENITKENVDKYIEQTGMLNYFNEEKNHSSVETVVYKYSDNTSGKEDLVKKVQVIIKYTINGKQTKFQMDKIKIKELT